MAIYLPKVDYRSIGEAPNVIIIDDVCYEKKQLSARTPTKSWNDVDEEFDDCEDCDSIHPCQATWTVVYNCETEEWEIPTLEEAECAKWSTCVDMDWFFSGINEDGNCVFRALTCDPKNDPICETPTDTCSPSVSSPTPLPDNPERFCPYSSSSSSSSSSSDYSSSSSSSSFDPGKATGPRFI